MHEVVVKARRPLAAPETANLSPTCYGQCNVLSRALQQGGLKERCLQIVRAGGTWRAALALAMRVVGAPQVDHRRRLKHKTTTSRQPITHLAQTAGSLSFGSPPCARRASCSRSGRSVSRMAASCKGIGHEILRNLTSLH